MVAHVGHFSSVNITVAGNGDAKELGHNHVQVIMLTQRYFAHRLAIPFVKVV